MGANELLLFGNIPTISKRDVNIGAFVVECSLLVSRDQTLIV